MLSPAYDVYLLAGTSIQYRVLKIRQGTITGLTLSSGTAQNTSFHLNLNRLYQTCPVLLICAFVPFVQNFLCLVTSMSCTFRTVWLALMETQTWLWPVWIKAHPELQQCNWDTSMWCWIIRVSFCQIAFRLYINNYNATLCRYSPLMIV